MALSLPGYALSLCFATPCLAPAPVSSLPLPIFPSLLANDRLSAPMCVDIPLRDFSPSITRKESTGLLAMPTPATPSPHSGSGTSKKLAKRNAAAKMLLRVHTVPLDARDGNEAEPEDDHFSIVSGLCGLGLSVIWE